MGYPGTTLGSNSKIKKDRSLLLPLLSKAASCLPAGKLRSSLSYTNKNENPENSCLNTHLSSSTYQLRDDSLEQKDCQCDVDTVIKGIIHEVGAKEKVIRIHIGQYRS